MTRKITRALANISQGLEKCLFIGNLDAKRDWGHAKDYVRMQWMMLQQDEPKDYVIATGKQFSVREFIEKAATQLGIKICWEGSGINQVGIIDGSSPILNSKQSTQPPLLQPKQTIVRIDPRYFRPAEVETLLGDPSKAMADLGWIPQFTLDDMIEEMIAHDVRKAKLYLKSMTSS